MLEEARSTNVADGRGKKIAIQLDPLLFECLCKIAHERGFADTPEEALLYLVKREISAYLDHVKTVEDPEQAKFARSVRDFFQSGSSEARLQKLWGRDRWPWTNRHKPLSFTQAVKNAKRRGRYVAGKAA